MTLPNERTLTLAYRLGLPMTTRFCYYPILGCIIYGLVGDIIEILTGSWTAFL